MLVNNKFNEIVDGIEFAINNKKYLKDELSELNQEKMELWNDRINHINKYINRT